MNPPADNTNTFPGPPTRSFDPSAESAGPVITSTVSAGHTPTPTPSYLNLPGHTCLRYLNKGGMGEVWLYHEHKHNREVAVKLCSVREETPATVIDRFVREYDTLRNLDHTKVVQVYEVGRVPGFVYYSMRFVPTGSLVRQTKSVRASARRVAEFVRKLAVAVEYVHQRNVLHRDLKPGNILVDERGEPLLADFGLAWVDDGHTTTLGGGPFGTPSYMAPEVTRAGPGGCTERSDIWAVGVILYELLAGVRPFTGSRDDLAELYRSIRHTAPPLICGAADALPDVDERLETICLKCLAKSPAHRYQSAGELADDLDRWLDGQPLAPSAQPDTPDVRSAAEHPEDVAPTVTLPQSPKPPGRWQPKVAVASLVAVLLTAAVLAVVLWPKQPVKKTLAERLAAGEKITFVDANGKLLEWAGNDLPGMAKEGSWTTTEDGCLELSSTRTYLLPLGNHDLPFPVVFEADVRRSQGEHPVYVCGLYAGHQAHLQADGHAVHTLYLNGFGVPPPNNAGPEWKGFVGAYSTGARIDTADRTLSGFVTVPSTREKVPGDLPPGDNPWPFHHLIVLIQPDSFAGRRGETVFKPRTRTALEPLLRTSFNEAQERATEPLLGYGFGMIVVNGDCQFRNVRLSRATVNDDHPPPPVR